MGVSEGQKGTGQISLLISMQAPLAHLKGVSDGQPFSLGQTCVLGRQDPSGHKVISGSAHLKSKDAPQEFSF
jgi:hypothetical protein